MRVNLRPFVPEGLIDSSLAVYCLGRVKKASRPVRDGMIWSARLDMVNGAAPEPMKPNRLYETGLFSCVFQAVNCQATIIQSLQDKGHLSLRLPPMGSCPTRL